MPLLSPTYSRPVSFSKTPTFNRPVSYSKTPLFGVDNDVKEYNRAGIALGESPLSNQIIYALNTLVIGLKSANLWNGILFLDPVVGGTAVWHSLNLKNPSTYRLVANGTITNNSSGTQGNGTNGYWDAGIDLNTIPPDRANITLLADGQISCYINTNVQGDMVDFGCTSSSGVYLRSRDAGGTNNLWANGGVTGASTDSRGFWTLSLFPALAQVDVYRNGSSLGSGGPDLYDTTGNLFFMAQNDGGSANYYSTRRYAFFSFGSGMNASQAATFNTLVQAFQTSLGRQV